MEQFNFDRFSANKIGVIRAFAAAGIDNAEAGLESFSELAGDSWPEKYLQHCREYGKHLDRLWEEAGIEEVASTKYKSALGKIYSLRGWYLNDRWDDAVSVAEWLGFFEGAAIVHWAVIEAIGREIKSERIRGLASAAQDLHRETFKRISEGVGRQVHVAGGTNA